jgi:hypothetical protein
MACGKSLTTDEQFDVQSALEKPLCRTLKQLPDEQQDEVADFVDFLLSRLPASPEAEQALRETAGILKGEAEGTAFEDMMRKQWERRH